MASTIAAVWNSHLAIMDAALYESLKVSPIMRNMECFGLYEMVVRHGILARCKEENTLATTPTIWSVTNDTTSEILCMEVARKLTTFATTDTSLYAVLERDTTSPLF